MVKLYPPNGKGAPVVPHPARVEQMKAKGWTEQTPDKPKAKAKPKEVTDNG